MKVLERTQDLVRLSWIQKVLSDHDIKSFMLDVNSGSVLAGVEAVSVRLMVEDDDYGEAVRLINQAEQNLGKGLDSNSEEEAT